MYIYKNICIIHPTNTKNLNFLSIPVINEYIHTDFITQLRLGQNAKILVKYKKLKFPFHSYQKRVINAYLNA